MREELLKGLTEEQVKKVKACKSSDEILALAKAEGVELSEEQLEAVSGGGCDYNKEERVCPKCKSNKVDVVVSPGGNPAFRCLKCGNQWRYRK